MNITKESLFDAIRVAGYQAPVIKDHYLNIIGVRSAEYKTVNMFNDFICLLWTRPVVGTKLRICPATTKPGLPALLKPVNPAGAAILVPGQYEDVWRIDLHKGQYKALCQRNGPVTVWRDNDKDREFDGMNKESGMFGINIHRASAFQRLPVVGWNSAGCQVFQDPADFKKMMELAERHVVHFGNRFTYTLLVSN